MPCVEITAVYCGNRKESVIKTCQLNAEFSLLHLTTLAAQILGNNVSIPQPMVQSPPFKSINSSVGQDIPRILLNRNVHHRVHNIPTLVLTFRGSCIVGYSF